MKMNYHTEMSSQQEIRVFTNENCEQIDIDLTVPGYSQSMAGFMIIPGHHSRFCKRVDLLGTQIAQLGCPVSMLHQ